MVEPVRKQREPATLTETDVEAAVARVQARDPERARDAGHVYDTLTWGEGPGVLSQAGLQDWLWYRLPTKYLTDEAGYMGRFAGIAAELFDELGLDVYAAVCRSEATAGVHDAFERSDRAGFAAMRKAQGVSGIEPPDLDDFEWGQTMGIEEASARSAAEFALEGAIADGGLMVGGRGWRARQREVTALAIAAEHPSVPGQTWRTAVLTERVASWVDEASRRSERLSGLRARVANRLLSPIPPPPDVAERLVPLTWLLEEFGNEQALTQAGYLNTAFLRRVHQDQPWSDPFATGAPPRTETDAIMLHRLRALLVTIGALRKQGRTLQRTSRGAAMTADPAAAWTALTQKVAGDPWDRFAVETCGLLLVDRGVDVPADEATTTVAAIAADMGWRTSGDGGGAHDPSEREVAWAISDTVAAFQLFGLLDQDGDWRHRRWTLTPAGGATVLAILRSRATGPRERPW